MASRAHPRITGSLAILAVLAAIGAGAIGATILTPEQPPTNLRPGAELTSAPVQQQQFDDQRTVPITLSITEATPLVSNVDGTVTALRVAAGQELASGSSPLDVDDVPILALHTKVPLYRDLSIGSRGADVASLQDELARLGYDIESDGYYGWVTGAAVKDLKTRAGAVRPDGNLPLAQAVWLPTQTVTPDTWTALLGSTAAAGTGYGTVPGRLTAVAATLPGTLAPGARSLTLWGQTAPLEDGRAVDDGFLEAVMQTRDYAAAAAAADPGSLTATIALTEPVDTLKVPPTALFGIEGDRACLQSGEEVFPVMVVGSALGASLVTVDEAPDRAAPTEVALGSAITAESCR